MTFYPFTSEDDEKKLYEELLKTMTLNLPNHFDNTGKAIKEFKKFLSKQTQVIEYSDPDLDSAIAADKNFEKGFATGILNAPGPKFRAGIERIHQALEKAKWDINKIQLIESNPKDPTAPRLMAFSEGEFASTQIGTKVSQPVTT